MPGSGPAQSLPSWSFSFLVGYRLGGGDKIPKLRKAEKLECGQPGRILGPQSTRSFHPCPPSPCKRKHQQCPVSRAEPCLSLLSLGVYPGIGSCGTWTRHACGVVQNWGGADWAAARSGCGSSNRRQPPVCSSLPLAQLSNSLCISV